MLIEVAACVLIESKFTSITVVNIVFFCHSNNFSSKNSMILVCKGVRVALFFVSWHLHEDVLSTL